MDLNAKGKSPDRAPMCPLESLLSTCTSEEPFHTSLANAFGQDFVSARKIVVQGTKTAVVVDCGTTARVCEAAQYYSSAPTPTISKLSPACVVEGQAQQTFVLYGTDLCQPNVRVLARSHGRHVPVTVEEGSSRSGPCLKVTLSEALKPGLLTFEVQAPGADVISNPVHCAVVWDSGVVSEVRNTMAEDAKSARADPRWVWCCGGAGVRVGRW